MKKLFFLRIGNDFLEEASPFSSLRDAVQEYRAVAQELAGFDQRIEATVHIAPDRKSVAEYPDYVLALGPRGGVQLQGA